MEVVVGTYEEVLLGYRITKVGEKVQFEQSFTDNSHTGCVKTVAISIKGTLASGGTDETIKLFNLKKRSELGSLTHHSGSVVGLEFHKGNHLFSVSEDGSVGIWKYYTWECLKTLRGHKSGVNSISVHPSGKMALTVSRDKTLKTWNLITGKCAYTTNLKSVADRVIWSTDGTYYAVMFQTRIDVYKVETAAVHCTFTTEQRPNDLKFLSDNILVYGCEGGNVIFYNITNNTEVHQIDTQTNRIRGIEVTTDEELDTCLFTASSDGQIKLYQINQTQESVCSTLLAEQDSKFRLTCISAYTPKHSVDKDKSEINETVSKDIEIKVDNFASETVEMKKRKIVTVEETVELKKRKKDSTTDIVEVKKRKKKSTEETDEVKKIKREKEKEKQQRVLEKQVEKEFVDKDKQAKRKEKKRKKFVQRQKVRKIKV